MAPTSSTDVLLTDLLKVSASEHPLNPEALSHSTAGGGQGGLLAGCLG